MFTIKYRSYERAKVQPSNLPNTDFYDEVEQLDGPFVHVEKTQDENGMTVVHCHRDMSSPGMTYGPWLPPEVPTLATPEQIAEFEKQSNLAGQGLAPMPHSPAPPSWWPRPTLWVMNEQGATVAKYDL